MSSHTTFSSLFCNVSIRLLQLCIINFIGSGTAQAGDTVNYTVVIDHTGFSTETANDVVVCNFTIVIIPISVESVDYCCVFYF